MIALIDFDTGAIITRRLIIQASFLGRLFGFAFKKTPPPDAAMLFLYTKRIHTFGMFFPLDIYFFDISMKLIGRKLKVLPNKAPFSPSGTRHILEIPANNFYESPIFLDNKKLSLFIGIKH